MRGKQKMSDEERKAFIQLKIQELREELDEFIKEGNSIYDWRTRFPSKVDTLKFAYQKLTGSKMSMTDFFVKCLGYESYDIKSWTTQKELEQNRQTLIDGLNTFVEDGNNILDWRTKFKGKVNYLKGAYEKLLGKKNIPGRVF